MQETIFTQFILPAALALIMFGMGLSLTKVDFSRLFLMPKPILIGLLGQVLLLPGFALCIAFVFNAPPAVAIGLVILAACPGGTSSNLISHVARANLALSVSLTAITTVICVFTTPFLITLGISLFAEQKEYAFSLLSTSLGLIVISIIPITIGMLVKAKFSTFALSAEPIFRKLSILFMVALVVLITVQERHVLLDAFPQFFLYAIALNAGSTIIGLGLAVLAKLSQRDAITLGIEIGTQNASLAILIAITFIQEPAFSVIAGVYGIVMYFGALVLVLLKRNALKD